MADGSVIIEGKFDEKQIKKEINRLGDITEKGMQTALVSIGAIATGIAGLGASAINFGTEYQKASNQLQASTNLTAEDMENLKEVMKNVYANNFGEDMNDVANSLATVRKELGALDDTSLQNATQSAIALRDTFDYDVSESVRSAKALMDNFGVSSDEAFNLIVQGAQNGLDYSGEMLDTISEYSVQFSKLGFSAEDMFNILQKGAESGAFNLDKVGDAVKEFSIRAIDGSDTTIDGFTRLGLNADEMAKKFAAGGDTAKEAFEQVVTQIAGMDDKVEQSIVGVDLFGTMWEDLGSGVVTQLANMTDEYNRTINSAEQLTQIKYDDMGSALQGIGRQLQTNLLLPISEKLLPVFNNLANKLNEAFSSGNLQGTIDEIANSVGNLVTGIATFVEKWLPSIVSGISWVIKNAPTIISLLAGIGVGLKVFQIAKVISSFITEIKKISTTVNVASKAFMAFNTILNANPIILLITVIGMLVTTFITLWNTNEDFRNAVINIWNTIKETIGNVINGIIIFFTETIPNAFQAFIQFWINLGNNIKNTFINAWNAIVAFFTETIPQWIQNIITWFQQLPYNIGLLIGQIIGHIIQFGINVWNWITTELPNIIQSIIDWFAQLPGRIWEWLKNVVSNITQWGKNTYNTAKTWTTTTITSIVNWFKQLPGKIWTWLSNTISKVKQWGSDMASKGKTAALNLVNNVINTIKNLPKKLVEIGKNVVKGIWDGIHGMANWLKDKISSFLNGIVDGIKGVLGIHSPSKVMKKEVGRFMAMGIGEGFDDNLSKVYRKMKSAVDFETQKLSTNLSTTATTNRAITVYMNLQGDAYMDSTKVGRMVAPTVSKTLKVGGVT